MKLQDLTGFAVDIGGTKTAAARIVAGEVVDRRTHLTDGTADLGSQLDRIEDMVTALGWRKGGADTLGVTVTDAWFGAMLDEMGQPKD